MSLNDAQQDAVETIEGPLLIIAGAGSGKTRVVTHRIVHMIEQGISPNQILGLTFTNKAAAEMKERVQKLTDASVLVCTFHSLGARILRESIDHLGYSKDFTIYDSADSEKLLRTCFEDLHIKPTKGEFKTVRESISQVKNRLQGPDEVDITDLPEKIISSFVTIYNLYQRKLLECQALDFDDLLFLPVRLFREYPDVLEKYQEQWPYLLIDEYQDTNATQYTLVHLLVQKQPNLCVVGDPDQSIYSWRGANIENILNFEKDFPGAKVVRLEQNYRSRSNILEAANELINYNYNRYEKDLWSDLGDGEPIKQFTGDDEWAEAQFVADSIRYHHDEQNVPYDEMVIFYRTNSQSRVLEDLFLQERIPYQIIGGISFYQRREIKDILAFLRVVYSSADYVSFARTINLPKRGIGDSTLEKLRNAAFEERMPIVDFCEAIVTQQVSFKIGKKQLEGLQAYIQLIRELRSIGEETSLRELVTSTIELSGYLKLLKEEPDTFDERKENLDALITKAVESSDTPLQTFLEELSLKASIDEANTDEKCVSFMTMHNGKGLEFQVTFLVGMEEDLFPHANSRGSREAVEEERRLCYVGMTRAKECLYLTSARFRYMWGMARTQRPSRFLKEIPPEFVEKVRPARRKAWSGY